MVCISRPQFYLSRRHGLPCETSILYVEAIWLALRDPNFPCRGETTCLTRPKLPLWPMKFSFSFAPATWPALRYPNFPCRGEMVGAARPEFSLSRRDGLCCGTFIFLVEARLLALRELHFPCRCGLACASRSRFSLSRRGILPNETCIFLVGTWR